MKQNRQVRFELSWSGVTAIMVVCVCICLWMFVLGVWTGQALLQPPSSRQQSLVDVGLAVIAPLFGIERQNGPDR
ncbi:hypothetical protein JWG42_07340 [Desulfoprunum benzoelyticum]|uniref:Uncharacterized protein n=1 Tax=Desulfoprunum benzoelyticum TaxID=1506996 RepID=A0A840UZB4_9BACT|nr:hypothetical protein [Desulfoprunum benzoelyticum]MBB5348794.1 hypothetical protein [Desulfoprunum benzoelyticum]MBM9529957.1 hypothetical protein [Desulfoprunum benzoelyticum]